MKAVRISLLGLALTASASVGFAQKTEKVTKLCLDSAEQNTSKVAFSYDERGNTTRWSVGSTSRYDYTYDDKGNITESARSYWDASKNEWIVSTRYDYTYDDKGNMIQKDFYHLSGDVLELLYFYQYRYDERGNVIEDMTFNYWCDQFSCGWKVSVLLRYDYTYDENGNITECITHYTNGASDKNKYTYDDKGNLTENIYSIWDNSITDWKERQKNEYAYNEKGYKTMYIYSEYDSKNGWQVNRKYEYNSYDSIGNYTGYIYGYLSESSNQMFGGEYYYEYTYHNASYSEADLVLPVLYDFSGTDFSKYRYRGAVTEEKRYNCYNDGTRSLYSTITNYYWSTKEIEVIIPQSVPQLTVLSCDVNLGTVRSYSVGGGGMLTSTSANTTVKYEGTAELIATPIAGKSFVKWSDGNIDNPRIVTVSSDTVFTAVFDGCKTGIVETHCNASLRVYPNPTNGQLTIECRAEASPAPTVEVYSVVGQMVYTPLSPLKGGIVPSTNVENSPFEGGRGMSEIVIDISHLANGMYYLKIGNQTVRFVKE